MIVNYSILISILIPFTLISVSFVMSSLKKELASQLALAISQLKFFCSCVHVSRYALSCVGKPGLVLKDKQLAALKCLYVGWKRCVSMGFYGYRSTMASQADGLQTRFD